MQKRHLIGLSVFITAALWTRLLQASDAIVAPAAPIETYELLVFNQPVAGKESEYNRWYDSEHAPDVVSIPGFVRAQRYVIAPSQLLSGSEKPKYLVIYEIRTADLQGVYAEVNRRLSSGETKISPVLDKTSGQMLTYRLVPPRLAGTQPDAQLGDVATVQGFLQLGIADPAVAASPAVVPGCNAQLAATILKAPGFTNAKCLVLSAVQLGSPPASPPTSLMIFEIQTKNFERTLTGAKDTIVAAGNNPALKGIKLTGYTYQALGPPLSGDMVRAARAIPAGK